MQEGGASRQLLGGKSPLCHAGSAGESITPISQENRGLERGGFLQGAPGSSSAGSQTSPSSPEGPMEALSSVLNTGPAQGGPCPTGHLGSSERSEGPSWTLSHCFNKSNF